MFLIFKAKILSAFKFGVTKFMVLAVLVVV